MMHLTFADRSFLVDDRAARVVMEYASALSDAGASDTVTLSTYAIDSQEMDATLLLNQGASLMAESTQTSLPEPDNSEIIAYMEGRLSELLSPPSVAPIPQTAEERANRGTDYDFD